MGRSDAEAFLDLLAAGSGIVCAVGAGGKKSTLYRLAQAHVAAGTGPVALTGTVMLAPPPPGIAHERLVAPAADLERRVPALARPGVLAYAQPSEKPGRLAGVPGALIADLHARGGFAVTLVKADGARMRAIKAPAPGEPVLPPGVATVLPVVSARAFGRPLDGLIAHRPERVAMVTGAAPGEPLTPLHVARLLASPAGALAGTGAATVVPVINMVDDDETQALAREAAALALGLTRRFSRVVLARMNAPEPVVAVVTG